MPDRIKVLCVDDSPDLAEVLGIMVAEEDDLEHVGTLHDAQGLLDAIQRSAPNVVVIDLGMAGKKPLVAIREACEKFPQTRSLVFSGHDAADDIDGALEAGAWGFVSKHDDPGALIDAVRRVARGEVVAPRG